MKTPPRLDFFPDYGLCDILEIVKDLEPSLFYGYNWFLNLDFKTVPSNGEIKSLKIKFHEEILRTQNLSLMIKNLFVSSSFQKKASDKLRQLLDIEQRYLLTNFSLDYLESELGIDKDLIPQVVINTYGQSFYELVRHLRISHLKSLVNKFGEKLSLSDYAQFSGFHDVKIMLNALKQETGLDFDDFRKYSSEIYHRNQKEESK